ncbi:MAG: O-antigen ligase family protein [Alphaproteobacteria bacterium]|nr:O-antigen ligase family protein [Alphaproteobacteria bacterium]
MAPNHQKSVHLTASVLAYLSFCLLMLSLRPFGAVSLFIEEEGVEGDRLNQIGFLIAGTIALLGLATLVNRRLLSAFLAPTWLAVGGVLLISVIVAPEPGDAARSVALTLIGMLIAAGIVLLPPDEKAFQRIAAAAILTVLAVSYAGITFLPELAIHGSSKYEPQHAGLWHGHFSHKNVAGPVMSVFVMFGIYLWRSKLHLAGAIITVLALLFVIQTGSKTTIGLLPIAIAVVLAGRIVGLPQLTVGLYVTVAAIMTGLTLGTIYSDNWASYAELFIGDPTFTGRVTLWQYGLENVSKNLWFGTGYDSFWGTPTVRDIEFPFDHAWDFRGIVHGHSNFVDMAVTTGLVGFVILLWALYIVPVFNYLKACRIRANGNLADLFMMILVFMTLLSFLESFFLRRIDPIWLMMFMAVAGLQLTARFRTTQHHFPSSGDPLRLPAA